MVFKGAVSGSTIDLVLIATPSPSLWQQPAQPSLVALVLTLLVFSSGANLVTSSSLVEQTMTPSSSLLLSRVLLPSLVAVVRHHGVQQQPVGGAFISLDAGADSVSFVTKVILHHARWWWYSDRCVQWRW